MIRIKAC